MTSQVAIMNLNGIAVASDTVATHNSDAGAKTTANSEKIYTLGGDHKVVALHYGSTGLNDLHHQFHFNRWVEQLGAPLPSVSDYLADYIRFSEQGPKFHSPESESREIVYLLRDHYSEIAKRLRDQAPQINLDSGMSDEEVALEYSAHEKRVVSESFQWLKGLTPFPGITESWARAAMKKVGVKAQDVWEDVLEGIDFEPEVRRQLTMQAPYVLARVQQMPRDSYLAFVGFGTESPFAAYQTLRCRSLINGRFLASPGMFDQVGPGEAQAQIAQFAQYEAINAVVRGYNNDIAGGYYFAIGRYLAEVYGDEEVDWEFIDGIRDKVAEYISNHSWNNYVRPLLRTINGMSNFSMAQLAETLVQIQATSSVATDGPASVGGLIEVLTIDRINGVQWMTRLPR